MNMADRGRAGSGPARTAGPGAPAGRSAPSDRAHRHQRMVVPDILLADPQSATAPATGRAPVRPGPTSDEHIRPRRAARSANTRSAVLLPNSGIKLGPAKQQAVQPAATQRSGVRTPPSRHRAATVPAPPPRPARATMQAATGSASRMERTRTGRGRSAGGRHRAQQLSRVARRNAQNAQFTFRKHSSDAGAVTLASLRSRWPQPPFRSVFLRCTRAAGASLHSAPGRTLRRPRPRPHRHGLLRNCNTGLPAPSSESEDSSAMRMASSIRVSTIWCSGTVLITCRRTRSGLAVAGRHAQIGLARLAGDVDDRSHHRDPQWHLHAPPSPR